MATALRPGTAAKVPVPAIGRAVQVLDALSGGRAPMTVSDLARACGLAKSSVSDLVWSLAASAMVREVDRGWVLGYRVLELGQSALSSTDLISEFQRLTPRLPALGDETVLIGVLDGMDVLYLARHNGNQPVRLGADIGRRLPAGVTALGKAMLAALPEAEREDWLRRVEHMPRLTAHSFATVDQLRADLAETGRRGYAIDNQQNTRGINCYGAAILGYRQPTAVSVTLLSSRVTPELIERLTTDILALARQLAGAPRSAG